MSKESKGNTRDEIINNFIDYWDNWHKGWEKYIKLRKKESYKSKINSPFIDWYIPDKEIIVSSTAEQIKPSKKLKLYRAFPEPYWMDKNNINSLNAVFLNINPGPVKWYHIFDQKEREKEFENHSISPSFSWKDIYDKKTYSETILDLIGQYSSCTDFWHYKNRLKWLKDNFNPKSELNQIACFDVFPWHTSLSREIPTGVKDDCILSYEYIIKPAIYLSQNNLVKSLKGKVIAYGAIILNTLFETIKNKAVNHEFFVVQQTCLNDVPVIMRLSIFTFDTSKTGEKSYLFIFSHRTDQKMNLPNLESYTVMGDKIHPLELKEFINSYPKINKITPQ